MCGFKTAFWTFTTFYTPSIQQFIRQTFNLLTWKIFLFRCRLSPKIPFICLYFYFWRGLNVKTIFIFHYNTHYDGFGDRHITLVPKEHGMASPIIILIFNSTLKDNLITKTKTFFHLVHKTLSQKLSQALHSTWKFGAELNSKEHQK